MKDKFMSLNGEPVVVMATNDTRATVMSFPKEDNIVRVAVEQVDINELESYKCPHADETMPSRVYCKAGICEYPVSSDAPSQAMYACMQCFAKSFEASV